MPKATGALRLGRVLRAISRQAALTRIFSVLIILSSSLEWLKGMCAEEVVDNVINVHKKNTCENSDFYSFLFEMWCPSRRSKKIKKEFIACQGKVVHAIKWWLEIASKQGTIEINLNESETLATVLLGMTDGTAFELIDHPEKLNDKKVLDYIKEDDTCCVKIMEKIRVQRFDVRNIYPFSVSLDPQVRLKIFHPTKCVICLGQI